MNSGARSVRTLQRAMRVCAATAAGLGVLALVGWMTGWRLLASIRPTYIPMAPNTALAFVLLGVALYFRAGRPGDRFSQGLASAAGILVGLLGAVTLIQFAAGLDLGIDRWLMGTTETLDGVPQGCMSPITAGGLVIVALSLLLLTVPGTQGAASTLAIVAVAIGSMVLLGYLYGTPLLYGGPIIPMALTTAMALVAAGLGLIADAGPEVWPLCAVTGPSTRARLLRAFLPATCAALIFEELLCTYLGQVFGGSAALVSAVSALAVLLFVSVLVTRMAAGIGGAIDYAEAERARAEEELRRLSTRYETLLSEIPDIIMEVDVNKVYTWANPAGYEFFGNEVIGKEATYYFEGEQDTYEQVQPLFDGNASVFYVESWQRRQDGEKRLLAWWCRALQDADGMVTGALSTARDITEQKQAEEQLKAALAEKEALLREVHHRVKNNLQAIIYLITMQAERITDAPVRQFLEELQNQARTMSLVYEQLYQSENLAQVDMEPYLHHLTVNVLQAFGGNRDVDLSVEAAGVSLDVETAMPCGLIVNELLTNALKHAFPPEFAGPGHVQVRLQAEGEACTLQVSDDGVGLPPGLDWHQTESLGLKLVNLWATHQLGGRLEVETRPGTTFQVTFVERTERNDIHG